MASVRSCARPLTPPMARPTRSRITTSGTAIATRYAVAVAFVANNTAPTPSRVQVSATNDPSPYW